MQRRRILRRLLKLGAVAALACFITFCGGEPDHPEGLTESGGGNGPEIIFDPLAEPVPEIPFPNDLVTVLDESTVTGRRINLSVEAPSGVERMARRKVNDLDGFGTYAPVSVAFDKPLDLSTVNENNIMIIKLGGKDAGDTSPLNLPVPAASYTSDPSDPSVTINKGFFPLLWRPDDPWWRHDPYAEANNVALDPENGVDIDGDGAISPFEFVNYYEFETNTLIIRPILPLKEARRYAVVLLKGLKGANGQPVKSPFKYINHTMQTEDLSALPELLRKKGISLDRVAFCWSFTTQNITQDWKNVWNGLTKGKGPLAYLNKKFDPVLKPFDLRMNIDYDGNPYTLNMDWFKPLANFLLSEVTGTGNMELNYIDYVIFGSFKSPGFFSSLDFGDPLETPGISFDPAKLSGKEKVDELEVTWILTVPKDEDMGLDGGQSKNHPHGWEDYEENCPDSNCAEADPADLISIAKGSDAEWGDATDPNCNEYLCPDSDDVPVPTGKDGEFGNAGVDDNDDGYVGDEGEYLWPGSDDVPDPAGDNHDPNDPDCTALQASSDPCVPHSYLISGSVFKCTQGNGRLDYYCGLDGKPGVAGFNDDDNDEPDDITEFGWDGSDDGITEDANSNGRLDTPPFPVAFYGHGHGSGGVESLGFIEPMSANGIALFGMDNFGHGPAFSGDDIKGLFKDDLDKTCSWDGSSWDPGSCGTLYMLVGTFSVDIDGNGDVDEDDVDGEKVEAVADEILNVGLFRVLFTEGRAYDTDGDGAPNSGRIFWTANIFQTRDLVRQTAIDWMQFVRIADKFGAFSANDFNNDGAPDLAGDFNVDGEYDIGGPTSVNTRGHYYFGSSLGGIMGVVNMGINPRMVVGAPVAGAGGLPDVIPRSRQGSATRPVMRQMCGPLVIGDAVDPGRVRLVFNNDPPDKNFGYLMVPPYGRIKVQNLTNGEVKVVTTDFNGNFSAGIPADVGDTIKVSSLVGGDAVSTAKTASPYKGTGLDRNTPDFRRFMGFSQWMLERGDPINLARHYFTNEFGSPIMDSPEKGVLLINTTGDHRVPINTGNAIASAAGLWSLDEAKTLIRAGLNLGYTPPPWGFGFTDKPIFDPEDLDDDGEECGFDDDGRCNEAMAQNVAALNPPLSVVKSPTSDRVSAVRWPYVNEKGHHAFALPGAVNHGIDWGVYMANQIAYYFASDGTCIIDDPWELRAAPMIHPGPNGELETTPQGDDKIKIIRVLNTLGKHPCDYDFPEIEVITSGPDYTLDTGPDPDDKKIEFQDMQRVPYDPYINMGQ